MYIQMYPCGEVYMAYVSSGIPLTWGVKVLHESIVISYNIPKRINYDV